MNGEIPSVPITTLAGVASLTNLLPELPLPTPLPNTTNNRNLLYHPQLIEEARKTLSCPDQPLVSQLVESLRQTTTDHIQIENNVEGGRVEGDPPALLHAVLCHDAKVFKELDTASSAVVPSGVQLDDEDIRLIDEHFKQEPLVNGIDSPGASSHDAPPPHGPPATSGPVQEQAAFLQFLQQYSDRQTPVPSNEAVIQVNDDSLDSCSLGSVNDKVPDRQQQNKTLVKSLPKPDVNSGSSSHQKSHKKSKSKDVEKHSEASKRKRESTTPVIEIHNEDSSSFSSLGDRVKRRRHRVTYKEDSEGEDGDTRHSSGSSKLSKRKSYKEDIEYIPLPEEMPKRNSKLSLLGDTPKVPKMPKAGSSKSSRFNNIASGPVVMLQDCMEFAPTQKKFLNSIEDILENAQQMDLMDLNLDDDDEMVGLSSESVISRQQLSKICSEAAKLNSTGYMYLIPTEKIVKLLTILQFSIRDGLKAVPAVEDDETDANEEFREIVLSKILTSMDASLVAMNIMTSKDMPKEVFIEEVIDKVVCLIKTQLKGTIFPEFDPVYRVKPNDASVYQGNTKAKRARSSGAKNRNVLLIYNKITEIVDHLTRIVNIQELTDGIVLQASTLAVSPFFVENINELQLNCMKLVTSIFTRYGKHRQLIVEDILASLARLPSSKKNLRSYRLNSEEYIQMVTALTLQLIQSVVSVPTPDSKDGSRDTDHEVAIMGSYENALRTAHSFLSVFLQKCTSKNEDDYRPLFENFVRDLLATVNKPEWPAAEVLLSLLGRLLVQQFNNKAADMSLRVASLDYLGIVAARLHRDEVNSKLNETVIRDIIKRVNEKEDDKEDVIVEGAEQTVPDEASEVKEEKPDADSIKEEITGDDKKSEKKKDKKQRKRKTRSSSSTSNSTLSDDDNEDSKPEKDLKEAKEEKSKKDDIKLAVLQQILLEYLGYHSESDPALLFARKFYWGQWYRDCVLEVERASKTVKKCRSSRQTDDVVAEVEKMKAIQETAEERKKALMTLLNTKAAAFASFKPSPSRLDYQSACLVTQYLSSRRPLAQSFEIYLTQILKVLCETAVAVRTRAMKSLTLVVDVDPGILARPDMQHGVHGRLLDQSTSVREAAVELIGNFILSRPELVSQYYDMLSDRILDTGISVRKRVIKIFRDICLEMPDFEKVPEMCVKMIRRVNDEEGIKKLVNETFQNMWFVPLHHYDLAKLVTRVMNITDVVAACKDTGLEWFEHLLENLLKKEEEARDQPVEKACVQLIECLIENVLKLECTSETNSGQGNCSPRLVSCIATLYLFCKIKPQLLTKHCVTLQPYLDIKCTGSSDIMVVHHVARILELAVPLIEHPNENFLAQLEEDMMKLILKYGMVVLQSCVSCLGAIVNEVTKNFKLVKDCFQRFFGILSKLMLQHKRNPHGAMPNSTIPSLLRALYTLGLLCRHFDFDSEDFGDRKVSIKDTVFETLMYFVKHEDEDVRHKALTGLGLFVTRHYEFMLGLTLRDLYQEYLCNADAPIKMRCQVLRNLHTYLTEEETRMMKAEDEWRKKHNKEDLKEMGDVQSGMASTIIQVYLKPVLESFFHPQSSVRMSALSVICLVLKQGLVHPVQIVPYLISMGSDSDMSIRIKADQQLQEIDKKYPGFIQMKAIQGVKMSYRLQEVLHGIDPTQSIRGLRKMDRDMVALNYFIYSLIRGQRGQRRSLKTAMLHLFDDTARVDLKELVFMADNLATFPYQFQDEPLYLIHQIDILVSVCGSNVLQSYKEIFYEHSANDFKKYDDDDEDLEYMIGKIPDDVSGLNELHLVTQNCILLLMLKNHLKEVFGFTDVKLERYSPTENAKVWDKPLNRKRGFEFNPKPVLDLITKLPLPTTLDEEGKRKLVQDYIDFKELMMSIDPSNEDDEDEGTAKKPENQQENHVKTDNEGTGAAVQDAENQNPVEVSGQNHDITVIDDEEDPEEAKAKNMSTPLTTSKSSYNKLLSLVSSSSKKPKVDSPSTKPRKSHSTHHKVHKHKKKKKKKKRYSDSNFSDSDDSSDPDFVG